VTRTASCDATLAGTFQGAAQAFWQIADREFVERAFAGD
jgi:hypothetical protein